MPEKNTSRAQTVVVLVTVPDRRCAGKLARALVREHLAACVNILPGVRSVYRWKGKIESSSELLLAAKTQRTRLAKLTRRVKALHPYSVPEVAALPILGGNADYLAWIRECVR
ncbi:MAG: divalent-cation tolerance protein CutA [Elusimicrobiota bacterium]|jgi:periplasmic divalent cation tolerance protein